MPDIVEIGPAWTLIAAPLLLLIAAVGACLDRVLARRSMKMPVLVGFSAPFDEAARLMRQRRRTTVSADRTLWRVGVAGLVVVALLKIVVLPLGVWTVADLPTGVVWFNAMDVMIWAVVWLAGWGANSHFSLIGAYRFLAQALSYELPLMFALTAPAVAASSLRLGDVVAAQQGLWFVVWMPVAFGIFCISVIAFSVWGPFSTAAGTDIAGGVLTEVSGVDRLMLLVGRYALLASGAAFAATLFLGGGAGPVLAPWAWTLVKTVLVLAAFVAVRPHLPAIRPDRFAEVGLVILMPLALLQLLVVSVVVVVGS
ncbi:Respiratory-chain NADH dehydrogenase, subunit 1 [Rhodococcus sp. AW25M09]|uniref:complex I subunit 1 family protein n=1 Tax=Rhodococcus sp. AW25M09 TaxID=1268303 RepID=UPI0002ACBC7F|nr:complex I subunit 1 family protein [Rhodococcus sp. AW25M09]CCQ14495.1 Respiratory-chain NADH dehydrogenase, subunit 1 [Rhodococcus sp. AW25M09]